MVKKTKIDLESGMSAGCGDGVGEVEMGRRISEISLKSSMEKN